MSSTKPLVQVNRDSGQKPQILPLLTEWAYLERAVHRILCGWGRGVPQWDGKAALHRQIWDQAECVRRLRERIVQFPGGRADAAVSGRLETLANAVLLAPSVEDALDGIHVLLNSVLLGSYTGYIRRTHPVHDQPTVALLHEIVSIKEQHRLWWRERRREIPHTTEAGYRARVQDALAACGDLTQPRPIGSTPARWVGIGTDFRIYPESARLPEYEMRHNILPFLKVNFPTSIEARRLFWAYAYMLEMNLPDEQLRWIVDSPDMPWEFHHDVSRHLWDESRHGQSGLSRLLDFGIPLEEIGFSTYGHPPALAPFTPRELHDSVFFITMVAETGHFRVKHEAYDDFRAGGDLESAEMMLFDIVDETAHVQYGHQWLPVLAKRAGIEPGDYRKLSAEARREKQAAEDAHRAQLAQTLDCTPANPAYAFYQQLLARMRDKVPLSNAATCPPRAPLPM